MPKRPNKTLQATPGTGRFRSHFQLCHHRGAPERWRSAAREIVVRVATAFTLILLLVATGTSVAAENQALRLDEWNGFRDAKFGLTRSQIPGKWTAVGPDPHDKSLHVYKRKADVLRFEGVSLSLIHYLFRNGRLVRVALGTRGVENAEPLTDALTRLFGEPSEPLIGGILWSGNNVELSHIYWGENRSGEVTFATFTHKK